MKKFNFLKNVANWIETFAYTILVVGLVAILFMAFNYEFRNSLPYAMGGMVAFILVWLAIFVPSLVTAHLIRLAVIYYELSYNHMEISKEILFELKSKASEQASSMAQWKKIIQENQLMNITLKSKIINHQNSSRLLSSYYYSGGVG